MNAAILELRYDLRPKDDVPAVDLGVRPEHLPRLLHIVADADRAPHVIDGVLVAGIVDRKAVGDLVPRVAQIGQLALVEFLEHAGLDLPLQQVSGGNHQIVTAAPGEQLGFQEIV